MACYDHLKHHSPQVSRHPSNKDLLINGINSNDLQLITKCIEQGADINATWPFAQCSIFSKAVEKGNLSIIQYLISKNPHLHCDSSNKITPLIVAIRSNCSLQLIEILISNEANVNESDRLGRTPLNEALSLNKDSIVKFLLTCGANVHECDECGRPPMTLAVANNRLEIVKLLFSKGAGINQSDRNGNSALQIAQRLNDPSILNYFQEKTSVRNLRQVQSVNEESLGPSEKGPITTEFVDENAFTIVTNLDLSDPNVKNSSTEEQTIEKTLQEATAESSLEEVNSNGNSAPQIVQRLNYSNNNVQKNSTEEPTINKTLQEAISEGSLEEVKSLLQENNVNQTDVEGFTPLARAVQFQKIEVIKFLLTFNANTCKMVNAQTPLQLAVKTQDLQIVQLLLEHGAEHTIQTAFFAAVNLSNLEIINFLIDKGVELNVSFHKSGYTVLTKAVESEKIDIVKVLVERGANVNMPDCRKRTPLVVALEIGNTDILSYLLVKGATFANGELFLYLQRLIANHDLKTIKILFEWLEVDIDVVFDSGYSPLTKATELGNLHIVEYFLSQNHDIVNKVDGNEKSPLSIAAANEDLPMVKCLINSGADINMSKTEIDKFANISEDFAIYMDTKAGKYANWK